MNLGLFVLRVVIGLLLAGHGSQKLFAWFGGSGLAGTATAFESIGLRPGMLHARAAGAAELAGGLLLTFGLITPIGSALVIAVMVAAIATVHASKGVWVANGGYEYNLVLIATAFALAGVGPGNWSLDSALNADATGAGWALLALAAGLIGGAAAVLSGQSSGRPADTTFTQPRPTP